MKKIVLLAFLMLLLTCLTWAKPITIDQARQVATNIIVERSSLTTSEIVETNVDRDDSGQPLFYIFNFRPKAFVMVAAEDNVLPVLGYCLDQTYSNSNHPIQFDDLLWSYRGQIQYARTHNLADTPVIRNNWQRLSVASNQFVPLDEPNRNVAPIIQTNWGQGTYYNYYCPSGTPVGCVAVAMGQIMKHWSFPAMGTGSHSYSCPPYGTQTANFGTTSYSWSLMPSSLTTNNTYLATLLYHLGVSVNMQYAPGGSGAYDNDAKSALTTYFGYKSTSSLIQKSGYTGGDTAWDLKMKS
ncbi:MAG TPA: C10 family peptidase, partial [Candidatus Cloacimonadota bacterium]|nr:C10 family peptidase [Candidatus Cloacimonadota bacterium]